MSTIINGLGLVLAALDVNADQVQSYEQLEKYGQLVIHAEEQHNQLVKQAVDSLSDDSRHLIGELAECVGDIASALAKKHATFRRLMMAGVK